MDKVKKLWRNSSSLIVLIKSQLKETSQKGALNYDILSFKRTEKTSFMQNTVVFPGGATDKHDEALEWLDLYKTLGVSDGKLKELSKIDGPRPFIFQKSHPDEMDREISLRITAARETFEEMGVLICKSEEDFRNDTNKIFSKAFEQLDILKWQPIVHNDPSQFIKLCREYRIAPDLWNMHEWSTWLTPSTFPRRFETPFFIVALNETPSFYPEQHEVAEYFVSDAKSLLLGHLTSKIFLPPPQLYELSRLRQMSDVSEVMKFARERSCRGQTIFCPVAFHTKDAFVGLLPGDDAYPENHDFSSQEDITKHGDKTAAEFMAGVKNLHRFEQTLQSYKFHMNVEPFDGHIKPVAIPENEIVESKL